MRNSYHLYIYTMRTFCKLPSVSLAALITVAVFAGCAGKTTRPVTPPVAIKKNGTKPLVIDNVGLVIEKFTVTGAKNTKISKPAQRLQTLFVKRLKRSARFSSVIDRTGEKAGHGGETLSIDVEVKIHSTGYGFYLREAAKRGAGEIPFMELDISPSPTSDILIPRIKTVIKLPEKSAFLLMQPEEVESTFTSAYTRAFRAGIAALNRFRQLIINNPVRTKEGTIVIESALADYKAPLTKEILLRVVRPRLVQNRFFIQEESGLVWTYLKALGGVEVSGFRGSANISSKALDSAGNSYTIANGDAAASGYRVSLSIPPTKTGWFFYPSVGYLSQEIDIGDFRETLPMADVPGSENIPGVASDPNTGQPVDATAPNVYNLELNSAYLGQRVGYNRVYGFSRNILLFFTAHAGMNLVEYRKIKVELGSYNGQERDWEYFRSGEIKGVFGAWFPSMHLALKVSGEWNYYNEFKYPDGVQFLGKVEYNDNDQKQIFERRKTRVESASFDSYLFRFAAAVVF